MKGYGSLTVSLRPGLRPSDRSNAQNPTVELLQEEHIRSWDHTGT